MLTSLSSSGFKCFSRPCTQALVRVNALYGLNGRGKSSFLQPLLLLSQSLRSFGTLRDLSIAPEGAQYRLISLGSFKAVAARGSAVADVKGEHDEATTITFDLTSEGQQLHAGLSAT